MYKLLRYANFKNVTNSAFLQLAIFLRITMQAFENLWISRAFFNKRVAHNYDIVMHTLAISIKKSTFGTGPLISGLVYQNYPQNISQSTIGAIQNGMKSVVRWRVWFNYFLGSCNWLGQSMPSYLKTSDVAIQVYPALQSMQAKVLPIKF